MSALIGTDLIGRLEHELSALSAAQHTLRQRSEVIRKARLLLSTGVPEIMVLAELAARTDELEPVIKSLGELTAQW